MKIATFLQIAVAVAGIVGGALAVLLTTTQKESMRLLRDNNSDLKERVGVLEGTEKRCKEELESQKMAIKVLTDTVTGAAAVDKLSVLVERHHAESQESLTAIMSRLR